MKRDYDIIEGTDDRKPVAVEHVYFKEPELLFGKTIGIAVYNFK